MFQFVYSFLLLVMTEFAYDAIGYTGLFFFAGGMETIGKYRCLIARLHHVPKKKLKIIDYNVGMVIAYFFPDNLTSDDYKERVENKP